MGVQELRGRGFPSLEHCANEEGKEYAHTVKAGAPKGPVYIA